MSTEQSTVYLSRYQVPTFVLSTETEYLTLDPSNLLLIEKVDDYEFNIRSILKVCIRVDTQRKLWILQHKREISCKFELDHIGMNVDLEQYVTGPDIVWNAEFSIFLSDDDEAIDISLFEERALSNSDGVGEDYFESQNQLTLYLFQRDLLNASNENVNEVFTKDIIQNMVARLLTQTKHKHVLMSPMENSTLYQELLVPALPAYKALMYLDQYYGFYKTGAILYYDVNGLYIINSNGKVKCKRENEYPETMFLITQLDRSIPGNGMIKRPGEKVYYCTVPDGNLNIQKYSILNNVKYGSSVKVIFTDGTTIEHSDADQSYVDQRNTTYSYITTGDNGFTASIMKARMEENETVIYIRGENFDLRAFTPHKLVSVVFDETTKQEKYGKQQYRISYAQHIIRVESDLQMKAYHRIALKRLPTVD